MGIDDYIKSLPMPLSKEEQQSLLSIFYSTRKDDVRELLITHNLRLAAHCVMKYQGSYNDLDELMSIATIELINVIDNKFDISRGVPFSSYAMKSIKLRLLDAINIKSLSSDAIYQSHQSTIVNKENKEIDVFDVIPDDTNVTDEVNFKVFIDRFAQSLNDYERELFEKYFRNQNNTYRDLAQDIGRSRTAIGGDINALKDKLKHYIQTGELKSNDSSSEIQSIIKYVKSTKNKKYKFVLEHLYGLNGNKLMSPLEINQALGCGDRYTNDVLYRLRKSGKIINKYSDKVDVQEKDKYIEEFYGTLTSDREKLIFAHRYGLYGCDILKPKEIAKITTISLSFVYKTISKLEDQFKTFVDEKNASSTFVALL